MKKEQILTTLATLGTLNIIVGIAMLLFVQPTGVKVSGLSCITIGICCLVIYSVKKKEV